MRVKVAQWCPTLCDPMGYTVRGILQARILEWVAFPFSRGSSQPRDQTQVSRITGGFFTRWATREALPLGSYLLFLNCATFPEKKNSQTINIQVSKLLSKSMRKIVSVLKILRRSISHQIQAKPTYLNFCDATRKALEGKSR